VNATELFVYRLRNYRNLETFIEEVSAVYDKKTLLDLYNAATEEPYRFFMRNTDGEEQILNFLQEV
jgi:hypothetical protein